MQISSDLVENKNRFEFVELLRIIRLCLKKLKDYIQRPPVTLQWDELASKQIINFSQTLNYLFIKIIIQLIWLESWK